MNELCASRPTQAPRAALALLVLLSAAGCDGTSNLAWRYGFANPDDEAAAVRLVAEVRTGGCDGTAQFRADLAPDGSMSSSPGALAEGTYGFYVSARNASCETIAAGCEERALPLDGAVFVALESATATPACAEAVACTDGVCEGEIIMDGGPGGPGETNGGPDDVDGGPGFDGGDCAGCYDATGACVDGTEATACGSGGVACSDCSCGGDVCGATGCEPAVPFDAVEVGARHVCARTEGRVLCWGSNPVGELGVNFGMPAETAQPIAPNLAASDVIEVHTAGRHTCVLRADGRVYCWGSSNYGQAVPDGSPTNSFSPVAVSGIESVTTLDVGFWWTLVVQEDGTTVGFGRNAEGQLATDPAMLESAFTPIPIGTLTGVTDVAGGEGHSCLLAEGTLHCVGRQTDGAVGSGSSGNTFRLYEVPLAVSFTSVEAGYHNSCALAADGRTFCTGCNAGDCEGALGFGVAANSATFEPLPDDDLVQLSLWQHMCAVATSGELRCSGPNASGELGVGDTDVRLRLTPVQPGTRWRNVGVGGKTSCGVRDDGTLYCWGGNESLKLGQWRDGGMPTDAVATEPLRVCPD